MPLKTADGTELSPEQLQAADADFHRMMATPLPEDTGSPPEYPAPPKKDPEAPYGRTKDGTPKKAPGGRPPKDAHDKARTSPRASTATTAPPKDYTEALADTATGIWIAASPIPFLKPYAALWKATSPGMVKSWNAAAQQNTTVRSYTEKLATGEGGVWMLGVAMASVPFIAGAWDLFKATPEQRAQVSAHNDQEFTEWIKVNVPGMIPEETDGP
jgi:hypothetical protein